MAKSIRDAYGDSLLKYGKDNLSVVALDADVSCSTKSAVFGNACPDRFINCGISEYAMMGMAAGLASSGKIPFVNTFAVFLTTIGALPARSLLSYSNLNVKMMGGYSGLSDAFDGPSHHAIEDLSIMRAMPNFTVLVASDEVQVDWMTKAAIEHYGPMYIRLSRDMTPKMYADDATFEIGKGCVCKEGTDVTLISCGVMVSKAMEAAELLAAEGINARVVDMYSIKPIDKDLIMKCASETGAIVTCEEHNIMGGLGSAVAEVLVTSGKGAPVEMVGLLDCHAETGSYADLFKKFKLDGPAIVEAAKKAIARK